jgi:hypothetical protein
MRSSFFVLLSGALLVSSCAELMEVPMIRPKAEKKSKFTQEGGVGIGGNPNAKYKGASEDVAAGQAPVAAGYLPALVGEGIVAGGMELPSDRSIVWSPTDPNADIPFSEAFKAPPKKKDSWFSSYKQARRESMRTGKPILMWFTKSSSSGSVGSPICKTLNRELFATNDFSVWAKGNVVRLKIDLNGTLKGDSGLDDKGQIKGTVMARRHYADKLRKQYQVLGSPTLVVLEPDGGVYSRERGYKRGQKNELWGKLKNAALTIQHNRGVWERKMAKKNYRRWTGSNDQVVFAKLRRFDEKSGSVWLVEPDGNLVKTSTKVLSKNDRGWILAEKERRGH